jgi:hypothetical protein
VDGWNEDRREFHETLLWGAWHGAWLGRVEAKHFPPLDKLLKPRTASAPQDKRVLAENLKAALMRVRPTGRGEPPKAPGPDGTAVAAE